MTLVSHGQSLWFETHTIICSIGIFYLLTVFCTFCFLFPIMPNISIFFLHWHSYIDIYSQFTQCMVVTKSVMHVKNCDICHFVYRATTGGGGVNLPWFWVRMCGWSPRTPPHSYTRLSEKHDPFIYFLSQKDTPFIYCFLKDTLFIYYFLDYTNFWPLLIWTLLPNWTIYLIVQGFHRTYATGAACQQRTLTPPDTWSCPIWDLQMFSCWDHWHSIIHYTVYDTFPWFDCLPTLTLLLNTGFQRAFATGVACLQGTLTPPDTWSCPTLGLACVLMSRPISPELVLSPDLWISNTPRYFSFAF